MNNTLLTPQAAIAREAEFQRIHQILAQEGDFLLVGAPGTGRQLLLREAARAANARVLEIDCLRSANAHQFLRLLANSITDCFRAPEEIALLQAWAVNYPITVEVSLGVRAQIVWHTPAGKEWPLFEALLALPQFIAGKLDCRMVIALQNFSHLRSWDRQGKWGDYLKQAGQRHTQVSYALVTTVVEPWASESPLPVIHLLPLDDGAIERWFVEAMEKQGLRVSKEDEAIALFLSYIQGHLGDAIALARRIWLHHNAYSYTDKTVCAHHIHRSMLALAEDMSVTFESLVMLLPPSQVRVLECLALDPTDSPQSRSYIKKHHLSRGEGYRGRSTA